MSRCKYAYGTWRCPLNALPGKGYCYWHIPEDGKKPDDKKLEKLKERKIIGVYFKKADLTGGDLQGVDLTYANLEAANLEGANLRRARLEQVNLRGANLTATDLRGAYMWRANLENAKLVWADLQKADLTMANLQRAFFWQAKLRGANLEEADLQEAKFTSADLQKARFMKAKLRRVSFENANLENAKFVEGDLREADLTGADLQGAQFEKADLREANLTGVNLQGADLTAANLQGANLLLARTDSKTVLDEADLRFANLYLSYLDETKTLRNAKIGEKEINEIVGDCFSSSKFFIFDFNKVARKNKDVALKLLEKGLVYYVNEEDRVVIFDNKSNRIVRLAEGRKNKYPVEEIEDKGLTEKLKNLAKDKDFLYNRNNRVSLYEASHEVYNNLYYFYIQNGRIEEALKVHYRRGEVRRKLLKGKGPLNWLRSWLFEFLILKLLTGYGVEIRRPLIASAITVLAFSFLFWVTTGIVKIVNGKTMPPDVFDYLYYSVITFTSLGYANIQPNLAVGHMPQLLAAIESCLGALMIALIIFVVTYRVSR